MAGAAARSCLVCGARALLAPPLCPTLCGLGQRMPPRSSSGRAALPHIRPLPSQDRRRRRLLAAGPEQQCAMSHRKNCRLDALTRSQLRGWVGCLGMPAPASKSPRSKTSGQGRIRWQKEDQPHTSEHVPRLDACHEWWQGNCLINGCSQGYAASTCLGDVPFAGGTGAPASAPPLQAHC